MNAATLTLTYGSYLSSTATARLGHRCDIHVRNRIGMAVLVGAALFRALSGVLSLRLIPRCYAAGNRGWVDARFLGVVEAPDNGQAV